MYIILVPIIFSNSKLYRVNLLKLYSFSKRLNHGKQHELVLVCYAVIKRIFELDKKGH